jgi:hypothetical protein
LIPLELGAAPADVANLWPAPWTGDGNAHQKDAVENFLNRGLLRDHPTRRRPNDRYRLAGYVPSARAHPRVGDLPLRRRRPALERQRPGSEGVGPSSSARSHVGPGYAEVQKRMASVRNGTTTKE